jgi:hypothetical protein
VDKYDELMQIRKMVKEDLFKRVKFITTTAMDYGNGGTMYEVSI